MKRRRRIHETFINEAKGLLKVYNTSPHGSDNGIIDELKASLEILISCYNELDNDADYAIEEAYSQLEKAINLNDYWLEFGQANTQEIKGWLHDNEIAVVADFGGDDGSIFVFEDELSLTLTKVKFGEYVTKDSLV